MKRAYEEIMEELEVTAEMRKRILSRLQRADFHTPAAKRRGFGGLQKLLAAAACLVVLAGGLWAARGLWQTETPGPSDNVLVVPDIQEAGSAQELSNLLGFAVRDMDSLPFVPAETSYRACWGEMAEIEYSGEGERGLFRKSLGSGEDNSGDFNTYDSTEELTVGPCTVQLRGSQGTYTLAVWSDDAFSYSLSLSSGATKEEWADIISAYLQEE